MKKNIISFYIISFLRWLEFTVPILTFFYTQTLWFSLGWSILLVTISGFFNAILEIPTGAIVDTYGRRRSYIIGTLITLVSFLGYFVFQNEWLYVGQALLIGFGTSLSSGNLEATIHDSLGTNTQTIEKWFSHIQANSMKYFFIGRAVAFIFSGILFVQNPIFPFIGIVIVHFIILLMMLFFLENTAQQLSKKSNLWGHTRWAIIEILDKKDLIFVIICITSISSIGNIYWFTLQPFLSNLHLSIIEIWYFYGILALVSAIGSSILTKIQDRYHTYDIIRIAFVLILILIITTTFNWISNGWLVLLPQFFLSIIAGISMTLGNSYIIHRISPSTKSTTLSIFSFAICIGYFIIAAPTGWIIDLISIQRLYFIIPFVCLIVLILAEVYRKTYLQKKWYSQSIY